MLILLTSALDPCPHGGKKSVCHARVQSLFNSLGDEVKGKTIALGGDGRYFNKEAAQIICKLAAGSGLKKVHWHKHEKRILVPLRYISEEHCDCTRMTK